MKILLTGANGFIGGHLLAALCARGHRVVAAVRDPAKTRLRFAGAEAIAVDFNRDTVPEVWLPRLAGIDAVINCAGILQAGRGQDIDAIHARAPIALFEACRQAGVRKVVQISAVSADADTVYARTKKQADDHLRGLPLAWTILRPSLVYAGGSYGGTSTLRGLAGLPGITPVIGNGDQAFRPLHVDDVSATVVRVLEGDDFAQRILEPVGPETLTLRQIVARYRRWLGLAPACVIRVPVRVMRLFARLADLAGGGPMGSASLAQLLAGNAGREADGTFAQAVGFVPASLDASLDRSPAQTQDLWHARLYFLRPVLRLSLVALWTGSGIAGLLTPPAYYEQIGSPAAATLFCVADLAIGLALLLRWRPALMAAIQLGLVGGYTVGIGLLQPTLWLDPFGALLKNVPILATIAVWAVLERER